MPVLEHVRDTVRGPLARALARVARLDLSRVKAKLVSKEGWSEDFADRVEDLYRNFLALKMLDPERMLAPTACIDTFWHRHILDTRAYQNDCEDLFGTFLHHEPSSGTPQERQFMARKLREIIELFEMHFGIDPRVAPADYESLAHCGCRCGCGG